MSRHSIVNGSNVHGPYRRVFTNTADRLSDSGVYLASESIDGGSSNPAIGLQLDTLAEYVLADHSPVTWTPLVSGGVKLIKSFSFSDVAGGSLKIGSVESGQIVSETALLITQTFNNSTTLTIGDSVAQGRLMAVADADPTAINNYKIDNDYQYTSDKDVYVYFPSGTPNQGIGVVIVYLA